MWVPSQQEEARALLESLSEVHTNLDDLPRPTQGGNTLAIIEGLTTDMNLQHLGHAHYYQREEVTLTILTPLDTEFPEFNAALKVVAASIAIGFQDVKDKCSKHYTSLVSGKWWRVATIMVSAVI